MDFESVTVIVALVGLVFTASAFAWGMYTWTKQTHRSRVNLHIQVLCQLYKDTPLSTLLTCHGIDPQQVQAAGIQEDEFRYLLINFHMMRMYQHSRRQLEVGPFRFDSYRYNLCRSDFTRRAFPFLREILGDVEVTQRIEATFAVIKTEQQGRDS